MPRLFMSVAPQESPDTGRRYSGELFCDVRYSITDTGFALNYLGSVALMDDSLDRIDVRLARRSVGEPYVYTDFQMLSLLSCRYAALSRSCLLLHAACVELNGDGILFCGNSGGGKSTQARLWAEHREAQVINYDRPCIEITSSSVVAHGSPWGGKEYYICNRSAPVKAIVFIRKANENRVRRLPALDSFIRLFSHNYLFPIRPDLEAAYTSLIRTLADRVPVYELSCDISKTAVDTLYEQLFTK